MTGFQLLSLCTKHNNGVWGVLIAVAKAVKWPNFAISCIREGGREGGRMVELGLKSRVGNTASGEFWEHKSSSSLSAIPAIKFHRKTLLIVFAK